MDPTDVLDPTAVPAAAPVTEIAAPLVDAVPPTEPAAPVVDHEAIAQAVISQMPAQAAPAAPPQPQMTEAELQKAMKVWNPDEQYVENFRQAITAEDLPAEQRLSAFHQMRDGVIQQAMHAVDLVLNDRVGKIQEQINPALTYVQQQEDQRAWNDFTKAHPDLADKEQLVNTIATQIGSQPGFKPIPQAELYTQVANATRQTLGLAPVQAQPTPATPAVVPAATMPTMATTQTPTSSQPVAASSDGLIKDAW